MDVVLPDSAASQAGIKEGDELLCVNNLPVNEWTQDDASRLLREFPDDEEILLHLRELLHPNIFHQSHKLLPRHITEYPQRSPDDCKIYGPQNHQTAIWEDSLAKTSVSAPPQVPPPPYYQIISNNEQTNATDQCPSDHDTSDSRSTPNPHHVDTVNQYRNKSLSLSQSRLINSLSDYSLDQSKRLTCNHIN